MSERNTVAEDLVDRYLAAVGRRLPPKQAADITAEMREALTGQLEALEERNGRPASRDEAAAILKAFGSPMLVAARYSGRDFLIGPELYPYFWPVARIVVGIVAALAIVGMLVAGVVNGKPMQHVLQGLAGAWNGGLLAFGIVAAVFIVMEQARAGAKIEAAWNPKTLPRDTREKPKSLFESLCSLAWDAIFIAWWIGVIHLPAQVSGAAWDSGVRFDFGPAWAPVHTLVLVLAVMQAGIHAADVVHPAWSRVRGAAAAIVAAMGLAATSILARGGSLFSITGSPDVADRVAELNESFATVSTVLIYGLALGFGIALVVELWRLWRSFQGADAGGAAVFRTK
ncbi:MAG: hypothetical protein GC155_07710 [Alphaproteobacteria bacterium]|nr:hypothetical protein [Alphaproteobacteria bacterium]